MAEVMREEAGVLEEEMELEPELELGIEEGGFFRSC
jgi:hypothetical protein